MPVRMHLALDISWTQLETQWRLPGSPFGADYPRVGMFQNIAHTAERGLFDLIFFGDGTGIPDTWTGDTDAAVRWGVAWPRQDMSPFITLMAAVTQHIGFGLTYASTFMHPYYVARLLNTLDHVTNGRIAFNVIVSQRRADAANYGYDALMDHNARYERLEEFIDVCRALWDSIDPDAFMWNRETGQVADPAKVHRINHSGQFFKVRGPLNTVPSPQGRPVIIQAGGSPRGTRAAAYVADHVFAGAKPLPQMVQQRQEIDAALREFGRDPASVGIIWSTKVIVAETEPEARALRENLINAIPEEAIGVWLSHNTGFDMATLPERFSLEELNQRIVAANASPVGFVRQLQKEHGDYTEITREEFFAHGLRAATGYASTVAGTAAQIADQLEERFEATGCRGGFMIGHSQAAVPQVLENLVTLLVPELQRRGRFRTRYEGRTLRENLATS